MKSADRGFDIHEASDRIHVNVRGKTVEELFLRALQGMASCMKEGVLGVGGASALFSLRLLQKSVGGKKIVQDITAEAVDINSLLIEFLSEVITTAAMNGAVFTGITFSAFGENFLEGKMDGVLVGEFDKEIQSVLDDDVDVKKNPDSGLFEAVLVFMV
jgi:SHS2 domain-containing protein